MFMAKAVISGEWCLRRDVEGTWRGRGSEKGLVVMRLADGEVSYCEEKFRGFQVRIVFIIMLFKY